MPSDFELRFTDSELTFGEVLRIVRLRKGLTLQKLSELSGLSVGCISGVEGGQTPSAPTVETIVKALATGREADRLHALAARKRGVAELDVVDFDLDRIDLLFKLHDRLAGASPESVKTARDILTAVA